MRANYEETQEDDDDDDDDDDDESLDQNSALEDHLKEKRNQLFEQVELSQRMAIAYMFVNGLGMLEYVVILLELTSSVSR